MHGRRFCMRWIIRGWPGPSADGLGPRLALNTGRPSTDPRLALNTGRPSTDPRLAPNRPEAQRAEAWRGGMARGGMARASSPAKNCACLLRTYDRIKIYDHIFSHVLWFNSQASGSPRSGLPGSCLARALLTLARLLAQALQTRHASHSLRRS